MTEHSHTFYSNQTHYTSISGDGAAPWGAGVPDIVVTGELGPGGDAGGCGKGGITGGYVEEGGWIQEILLRQRDYCSDFIH